MLKKLFDSKKESLNHFFEHVDITQAEKLFQIFSECSGVLIFTGVGKSGLIAEKIAVTMTSTGSRALYMSPINALHGDIGFVSNQDVVVLISKSGESDELFNLIPTIRNKKAKLVAITCNTQSRLAKSVDFFMPLPMEKELCPFNMVPTTSTTIQLILGDVLAIALMNFKNFGIDQFAQNHPSGRIGKRIILKVADLMLRGSDLPLCKPQDKLVDVLVELSNKKCGCILIVNEEQKLLGIFTDGDLRRSLLRNGVESLNFPMEQLIGKNPRCISSDKLAWEAMKLMEQDPKKAITEMPVVENDRLIGLIRLHDIVQSGL